MASDGNNTLEFRKHFRNGVVVAEGVFLVEVHDVAVDCTDDFMGVIGSVRISVSGEVIPGAAQRGCPLYLRCSMPDLMR